jgi:YbgC/YbaW family acyl-CoA thioester hydrolase
LIETADDWGTAQLGDDNIEAYGKFWIIRETEISFFHPLHHNDVFEFTIWLVKWHRVRGIRAFELKLKDGGEVVAQGIQQIVCLDQETMRPTNPPEHFEEHFRVDNPREIPQQRFPNIPPAPDTAFMMQKQVEWQDLDILDIVNNAVYLDYVEEVTARALEDVEWSPTKLKAQNLGVAPSRIHIQYQTPSVWGDNLDISTYLLELNETGGIRYVGIQNGADGRKVVDCIIDWNLVDLVTGEPQILPDSLLRALEKRVADPG